VVFGGLFAAIDFDDRSIVRNIIIVCFDARAINSISGDLNISRTESGQIQIGLKQFDELAIKYDFIEIKRVHDFVKDQEWHDTNGAHLMNIFRITIKDNDVIYQALAELEKEKYIIFSQLEYVNRPYGLPTYPMSEPNINSAWHIAKIMMPELWYHVRDAGARDPPAKNANEQRAQPHVYDGAGDYADH
jgi:hypothetical protein